ncbi:MAG: acetyl-CoA carboxylase biotin carboxyl carrier protein subunit [Caulobacteraceae bacterium]|nr:acetyl-CoA carboxylase biotin carboxyl carrier protein subunit [Caulobacteraceae bacterium]
MIAIIEAMKMEHDGRADRDGRVLRLCADVGDQVGARTIILEIGAD